MNPSQSHDHNTTTFFIYLLILLLFVTGFLVMLIKFRMMKNRENSKLKNKSDVILREKLLEKEEKSLKIDAELKKDELKSEITPKKQKETNKAKEKVEKQSEESNHLKENTQESKISVPAKQDFSRVHTFYYMLVKNIKLFLSFSQIPETQHIFFWNSQVVQKQAKRWFLGPLESQNPSSLGAKCKFKISQHRFCPFSQISKFQNSSHLFPTGVAHVVEKDEIATNFWPLLGPYSSVDEDLIRTHFKQMVEGGIGVVVLSWWGRKVAKDENSKSVIDTEFVCFFSFFFEFFKN